MKTFRSNDKICIIHCFLHLEFLRVRMVSLLKISLKLKNRFFTFSLFFLFRLLIVKSVIKLHSTIYRDTKFKNVGTNIKSLIFRIIKNSKNDKKIYSKII